MAHNHQVVSANLAPATKSDTVSFLMLTQVENL